MTETPWYIAEPKTIDWFDSPNKHDRRMGLTLWPSGQLTLVSRLHPGDVWSSPITLGEDVGHEEALAFAVRYQLLYGDPPDKIMLPYQVLVWVEVDLGSRAVTDVRVTDIPDNYDHYPAGDPPRIIGMKQEDEATLAETQAALAIADEDAAWPPLRIESSDR